MKKGIMIFLFIFIISIGISLAGNYGAGTYGSGTYGTGEETDTTTTTTPVAEPTGGGTSSGAAPSPTKFSSTTVVNVVEGGLAALTIAQGASFTFKGATHTVDIKEIGEDFVRLWVYSDPIQVILFINKRANIDLDDDRLADISIELRDIKNNNAFLYFKELQGQSKVSIPTGQQVLVEEQFEMPKITLSLEKEWSNTLERFQRFVKININYWINNIKSKKSWLIPSLAAIGLLLLSLVKSFNFYLHRKNKI